MSLQSFHCFCFVLGKQAGMLFTQSSSGVPLPLHTQRAKDVLFEVPGMCDIQLAVNKSLGELVVGMGASSIPVSLQQWCSCTFGALKV